MMGPFTLGSFTIHNVLIGPFTTTECFPCLVVGTFRGIDASVKPQHAPVLNMLWVLLVDPRAHSYTMTPDTYDIGHLTLWDCQNYSWNPVSADYHV
jgi:hypothetical protein